MTFMIIPLVSAPQCLTVQTLVHNVIQWVQWFKCVDCLFSSESGFGGISGFSAFLFFRLLQATVERAQEPEVLHADQSAVPPPSLCGEDMFSKYIYAGHIRPPCSPWLDGPLCLIQWRECFLQKCCRLKQICIYNYWRYKWKPRRC